MNVDVLDFSFLVALAAFQSLCRLATMVDSVLYSITAIKEGSMMEPAWYFCLIHLCIISEYYQAWLQVIQKCFLNEWMKIDYCDFVFLIHSSQRDVLCCFLSNNIYKRNTDILLNRISQLKNTYYVILFLFRNKYLCALWYTFKSIGKSLERYQTVYTI